MMGKCFERSDTTTTEGPGSAKMSGGRGTTQDETCNRRCGLPTPRTHYVDRDRLFLSAMLPDAAPEATLVTSLFVKRDMFCSFFRLHGIQEDNSLWHRVRAAGQSPRLDVDDDSAGPRQSFG